MLKLVRSALVYLVLRRGHREAMRAAARTGGDVIVPLHLPGIEFTANDKTQCSGWQYPLNRLFASEGFSP